MTNLLIRWPNSWNYSFVWDELYTET